MRRELDRLWGGWGAAALMAAALAACASNYDMSADAPGEGRIEAEVCSQDGDCDPGQMCDEGLCTMPAAPDLTVALQLTPPCEDDGLGGCVSEGLLKQQHLGLVVGPDRRLDDLVLHKTVTLSGTVTARGRSVAATIVARAKDTIPGKPMVRRTTAAAGSGYTLTLLAGVPYDITAYPEDGSLPSACEKDVVVTEDGEHHFRLPAQYDSLSGRVVVHLGDKDGVPGIKVTAEGEDPSLRSTVAVTRMDGRFQILVPRGEHRYRVTLTPTDNPFFPRVEAGPFLVDGDLDLGDLELGAGGDAVTVQGRLLTSDGGPAVGGATLEFSAAMGNGTFLARAQAEPSSGDFKVALLPDGDYYLRIVPDPGSPNALTIVDSLRVEDEPAEPVEVTLREKARVTGKILDSMGRHPVGRVVVEALLVGNGDVHGLHRFTQQVSSDDGTFSLDLDPGRYDLTLIPPPDSGLPRWIGRDLPLVTERGYQEFRLKDPIVVHGELLGPDASPAPGFTIEAYVIQDGAAYKVAEAVTDPDGGYRLVVPDRL